MDKGKIYKITNKINNKVYIGCTVTTLEKRYYEHLYRCFKTDYKSKLYNSIKKYGEENFEIELIEECEISNIYEIERKYIEQYDSFKNGLNSTLGGEGCLGYIHSSEIRKKISKRIREGNSHKGKTYEELYGDMAKEEKERRKKSVKQKWDNMSIEDKEKRINNIKIKIREKSKYSIDLIIKIKEKIKEGKSNKEIKNLFPEMSYNYITSIKTGKRWNDI
jgi:group I intron endonuclease